jgi:lambda repressor-like predicted transcriptional regulator
LVLTRSFPTQALRDYLRMLVRTGTPIERIAPELGLTEHHLTKLLRRPFMRDVTADRIAIALGMHPCQLWPEWFPPTPRQAQPSLYGGQVTSRAEASPRVLVAPAVAQPGDGKLRALPAPDTGLPARVPDRAARTTRT